MPLIDYASGSRFAKQNLDLRKKVVKKLVEFFAKYPYFLIDFQFFSAIMSFSVSNLVLSACQPIGELPVIVFMQISFPSFAGGKQGRIRQAGIPAPIFRYSMSKI
ncbi:MULTISPECIES: hypothetical protein [Brevibacillus]|uniref:hypothetical protein n=1 Tax=Brevibacillus TaxID=55080 RepID=UPI000EEE0CC6|nr:hypothetical protein [Brevibacillus sp.]HBZ81684.1 hypothetical protein [Brevibacillus sp.]